MTARDMTPMAVAIRLWEAAAATCTDAPDAPVVVDAVLVRVDAGEHGRLGGSRDGRQGRGERLAETLLREARQMRGVRAQMPRGKSDAVQKHEWLHGRGWMWKEGFPIGRMDWIQKTDIPELLKDVKQKRNRDYERTGTNFRTPCFQCRPRPFDFEC